MNASVVTSRSRFTPIFEWMIAAAFLLATVVVGAMLVRELRAPTPRAPQPQPARAIAVSVPPSIPARAVSVPVLPLRDGRELRIGESVQSVASRLGRSAESGRQEVDRGSLGERLTRFYDYGGARFILVFEPFERNGESRLAAIYLPEAGAKMP